MKSNTHVPLTIHKLLINPDDYPHKNAKAFVTAFYMPMGMSGNLYRFHDVVWKLESVFSISVTDFCNRFYRTAGFKTDTDCADKLCGVFDVGMNGIVFLHKFTQGIM